MAELSKNKFRWILCGLISIQMALINILLLFSVRSIWPLINRSLESVIGLGENTLLTVILVLILLLLISAVFLFMNSKRVRFGKGVKTIIVLQVLIHVVIFLQLYPNLESMYLSQMPFWLLKEKVLVYNIVISFLFVSIFLVRYNKHKDAIFKFLGIINGYILIIVFSFAYMAFNVRSSDFAKNSIDAMLNDGQEYFSVNSRDTSTGTVKDSSVIQPGFTVPLNMENGGNYISAGDLTGDGIVELVTAKIWVEPTDINRIKSISVQTLTSDTLTGKRGREIWNWNSTCKAPDGMGAGRGSSAAIAVFNLETGEANRNLLFATDGWLYEYKFNSDGSVSEKKVSTGTVGSSDCLVIANLDGSGKHHLLLKDAYHTIWAYDKDLNLIWKTKNPGGYLLAHRIAALDLNDDGKDEIIAGASILNGNGEVTTTLNTNSVKLWYGGHIDGIVPIKQDGKWNIGVTYCDALGLALFDVNGNLKWEVTGEHFEYLVGGYFFTTGEHKNQFQLISKVHYKEDDPQVMMNQDGELLGMFTPSSAVFSADWTGDGYHELIFLSPPSVYSETKKTYELAIPDSKTNYPSVMRVADLVGKEDLIPDGIPDIVIRSVNKNNEHFLHVYPNKHGKKPVNYVYPGIGWESSANYFTKYYEYDRK